MNPYLLFILAAIIGRLLLDLVADLLNVRHLQEQVPDEFADTVDATTYATSQRYLKAQTRFHIVTDTLAALLTRGFMLAGGFNWLDQAARHLTDSPLVTGLVFAGLLMLANQVLSLPIAWYSTFVLEARFGFNKTTVRTFLLDRIKNLCLVAIIGGTMLALILWFFETAGQMAWLIAWGATILFQLSMMVLAPTLILPLFNKYEPLEAGTVRDRIEAYARQHDFAMRGVYRMDGSKRSTKTNAFFTGFGRARRVVLFDTLIARHSPQELVAVIAHEVGHYKKGHLPRTLFRSILMTGLTFAALNLFIENPGLFDAFKMTHVSVYASFVFFGFLYTPLALIFGIAEGVISRRHEYEADAFAVQTTGDKEALITALKKLSKDNLANLTPHPFKVFLSYSHPPLRERIHAIRTQRL
ncbi:MAG: M48 family metallopeptidase [Verrucomicrobia bacterium]|nr:M48 family metallopeptidase [Verrucomicrobiota bacterium]